MIRIDMQAGWLETEQGGEVRRIPFSSPEAFAHLSELWLRCGFDNKYVYQFTWMGRPIIQLPEDLMHVQETIVSVKPDVIVELGVAHGGGVVFYATLCKALGQGRVIGIDAEIRPHNRQALETHPLRDLITLIEGNSLDPKTLDGLGSAIGANQKVLVIADSKHTKDHVLAELEAYSRFVPTGSYLIVADGIMPRFRDSPLAKADWSWNHPLAAVEEFLKRNPDFISKEPEPLFREGPILPRATYWPSGYLFRTAMTR